MESLPIIPIAHNSYIDPVRGLDLKTRRGASDFGYLKDKWARFECKFFGFTSGVKPKVSKLLRRHLSGESDSKEDVEASIVWDLVP
jgi:hypothetical protein